MESHEESLSKTDYETLAEFRYALRKFLGFSEAAASEHGVTPQQYQALLAIEGFPERNWVTIGELAEQMRVAHHSAVGLVDRMETMRLVKRTTGCAFPSTTIATVTRDLRNGFSAWGTSCFAATERRPWRIFGQSFFHPKRQLPSRTK